jgi:hypothetical protein
MQPKRSRIAALFVFGWLLLLLGVSTYICQERPTLVHAAPASSLPHLSIYSDALASGWSDWSWSANANFFNTSPTYNGSARSIAVTYDSAWGGLSLHYDSPIDPSLYQAIVFWVHGGTGSNKQLRVYIQENDSGGPYSSMYDFTAPAGTWTPITATMAALGNPSQIKRINIQNSRR